MDEEKYEYNQGFIEKLNDVCNKYFINEEIMHIIIYLLKKKMMYIITYS